MSYDIHALDTLNGKYICSGRGITSEALERWRSDIPQFYLMEEDLPDLCEEVFEEFLMRSPYEEDTWRETQEDLAEIILEVKKRGDATFEAW
jgi:hypothetical protein